MTKQKKLLDLVLIQLHQYPMTKRMVHEYEEIHLPARMTEAYAHTNTAGDPTGREAMRRIEPPRDIQHMRGWIWAIEQAWAMIRENAPDKAELMERLFGLNGREVLYGTAYRREELMDILHISEPTLYRWRDDILSAVMAGAIQAGVLKPYAGQVGGPAVYQG